jgi:hypothetical protein
MDADQTADSRRRMKLVAVLGAALLALPGGFAIGNAFAADGSSEASTSTIQQEQDDDADRPDRDCPKEDGGDSGGEGSGTSTTTSL